MRSGALTKAVSAALCASAIILASAKAENDPTFGSWQPGAEAPNGFLSTHATLLRDGRILAVGGSSYYCCYNFGKEAAHYYTVGADSWSTRLGSPAPYGPDRDAFCSGHAHDDGSGVIFQGGLKGYGVQNGHGIADAARFDPATGTFTPLGAAAAHWYPTLIAGVEHMYLFPGRETHFEDDPAAGGFEIRRLPYGQTAWQTTGANILTTATYPRVHLLPNGKFFIASPHGDNWTNTLYDPATGSVTAFGTGASQKVPQVGAYADGNRPMFVDWGGTSVLLPLTPSGGGYPAPKVALFNSQKAYVRNVSSSSSSWQELGVRPPELPNKLRRHANATLLPTGQVLVTGGVNVAADATGIRDAEVYDPDLGQWLMTTAASVPRNYHSVALLLPDGRVWTASSSRDETGSFCGNTGPGSGEAVDDQCPNLPGAGNTGDKTQRAVEYFRPWYVGHADRPTISNCPARIAAVGQHFTIAVGGGHGNTIGRVALMRPGSVTHAFDGDQRLVWLDITAKSSSSITVRAPYSANAAPPGDYMMFASRDRGAGQRFKHFAPSAACWTRVVTKESPPGAPIWRHTGTACTGESCPGWQRLDNNHKTVAILSDGATLYQLHNDGWIWRYTGDPCNGDACPGWRRLDNNRKTVAIAGGGAKLYQLHNDGWIWRHTGTACTGESCPGWQRLDNNAKTIDIAANNSSLYQLHNDGWIWRSTGAACTGESCPGWQRLDNNHRSVAIAAAGSALYQLHRDGWVWRYTGTPCSGESCPGWRRLDNNPRTGAIVAGEEFFQLHTDPVYQRHNNGAIWRYTGTPCSGDSCPGWQRLDNNPRTVQIVAGGRQLYQRHNNGSIWRSTGRGCDGDSCPGWQRLDNNARTIAIAAGGAQLYQLHTGGRIWRFSGKPCADESCPSWRMLDNNPRTTQIAASETQLFQRHNNGHIWRHTGKACAGESCPGWERLDNNPRTAAIAAGGNQLFQLHSDGKIWRFTGKPCSGTSCPGWQMLDNNARTREIVASGTQLYQRHDNGAIWHYTGPACSNNSCPGWRRLDNNTRTVDIETGN